MGTAAVSADLHDPEVAVAVETELTVQIGIDAPSRCLSLLAKSAA